MSAILTKKELAELLKVSQRTIDNLRKNQGLPCAVVGRSIRFTEEGIDAWLQKQHQEQNETCQIPKLLKKKPADG